MQIVSGAERWPHNTRASNHQEFREMTKGQSREKQSGESALDTATELREQRAIDLQLQVQENT